MDIPSREIHGNVHSKKQVMAETCEPSKCGCRASRTLKDVVSHDGGRRRVRPPTNAGRPKATGNKPNGTAMNSSWYSVLVQVATGLRHVEMLSLRQQHVTEPTAAVTRFVQCLFSWGGGWAVAGTHACRERSQAKSVLSVQAHLGTGFCRDVPCSLVWPPTSGRRSAGCRLQAWSIAKNIPPELRHPRPWLVFSIPLQHISLALLFLSNTCLADTRSVMLVHLLKGLEAYRPIAARSDRLYYVGARRAYCDFHGSW